MNADYICAECSHFEDEHDDEKCWRNITAGSQLHPCLCAGYVSISDALAVPA